MLGKISRDDRGRSACNQAALGTQLIFGPIRRSGLFALVTEIKAIEWVVPDEAH
jgi:hypothetical protein